MNEGLFVSGSATIKFSSQEKQLLTLLQNSLSEQAVRAGDGEIVNFVVQKPNLGRDGTSEVAIKLTDGRDGYGKQKRAHRAKCNHLNEPPQTPWEIPTPHQLGHTNKTVTIKITATGHFNKSGKFNLSCVPVLGSTIDFL